MLSRPTSLTILSILTLAASARPADQVLPYQVGSFISAIDGQPDIFAFAPARQDFAPEKTILMVYLHGMGQNHGEPFNIPARHSFAECLRKEYPNLAILSCNYGTIPYWCKAEVRQDITANIRQVLAQNPAGQIVLVGSSMGGTSVLTYAATAPADLLKKIRGVIAVYPSGDLLELHNHTSARVVASALERAFGNPATQAELYDDSSLKAHLSTFPVGIRVCIIEGMDDTVVPIKEQRDVVIWLKKKSVKVSAVEIRGNHMPPAGKLIVEALNDVLQVQKEGTPDRAFSFNVN